MLFNSLQFLFFIVVVYSLYLVLDHRHQNRMLLAASYVFYGAWDWRFLSLILLSTVLDFFCALKISETDDKRRRRMFLFLSVFVNLGVLGFFKYFNFFAGNMHALLNWMGLTVRPVYLDIILPLGISFYTFQTMSYTIDVFRKEMKPTRSFPDFALFVAFFPQLVAGPIERAKRLLPQILQPRQVTLEKFYEGCFLIFWGLFMKMFIADNLAKIVDPVYAGPAPFNGIQVLLASYAFTFQIFCDFAGYSNVARGLGKIMGFEIMLNFNLPFFVTNIQDYWNRWHISLSSWLRDYLYIPLFRWLRFIPGNWRVYVALMVNMTLIGLWHGAAWNFVIFGVYYGLLLSFYVVIRMRCSSWIRPKAVWAQRLWKGTRMVFMFHLVVIGMLIFRSQNVANIFSMLSSVFVHFTVPEGAVAMLLKLIYYASILLFVQLVQYFKQDLMWLYNSPVVFRAAFYLVCMMLLSLQGVTWGNEFIYFQF